MLITAAHVYRQYLQDRRRVGPLVCQVANTTVKDLSGHLIACGNLSIPLDEPDREPDIATFRLSVGAADRIGERPLVASAADWPPPPKCGEQVMFGGFPAQERQFVSGNEINFGFHSGMTMATSVTEHQITVRLEREFMIDQHGTGLPPLGYRSENRYLVFQVLTHTVGLNPVVARVFSKAHDQRNLADMKGIVKLTSSSLKTSFAARSILRKRCSHSTRQPS